MRSSALVWLGLFSGTVALGGCSFIDDFNKFHAAQDVGARDDSGVGGDDDSAADDDGVGTDQDADVAVGDAARPKPDAGSGIDAGDEDAGTSEGKDSGVGPVDTGVSQGVCGDGVIDRARGETCDDRNQVAGDGCEPVTCTATPPPTCEGKVCSDNDPCTVDTCDAVMGCTFNVIDGDGDGYSPDTCRNGSGHRGGDCNDGDKLIHPDAVEICDGIDNNCDSRREIDDGLPKLRCYPDLDGDKFPNLDAAGVQSCSCSPGTMVVNDPTDRSINDCWDDPVTRGSDVFPGQKDFFEEGYGPGGRQMRSFDYDCDGKLTPRLGPLPDTCGGLLGLDCKAKVGFSNEVPSCGESAEYTTCGNSGLNCSGTTDSRKQACR